MLRLMLLTLALIAGFLPAQGDPLTSHVICDVGMTAQICERGVRFASMLDDGSVAWTLVAVVPEGPQVLTTSWTDQKGVEHVVTTEFPSTNPSTLQITQTIAKHNRLVSAMQSLYPPVPGGEGVWILPAAHQQREAVKAYARKRMDAVLAA